MRISSQFLFLLALIAPNLAFSSDAAPDITFALNSFLQNHSQTLAERGFRSEYTVGNIDPRFNSKPCTSDIKFTFNKAPISQNNVTIKAACKAKKAWKLYISVEFNIFGPVIVAKRPIPRGQLLNKEMLDKQEQLINRSHHVSYSSKKNILGMIAKRSIRAGSIIQANFIAAPKLVKRGDSVMIVASNDAISVKMKGTALMDGSLGQQISVKNDKSKRIIKATVSKNGLVNILL